MNDWEKALFMLDEGFTMTQLKSLNPSDAEAWIRLKPLVLKRDDYVKKNTTKDKLKARMELMLNAFDKCKEISNGWYLTVDVRNTHIRSASTFYHHLDGLKLITKYEHRRAFVLRPNTKLSKTIVKDTQPIIGGCQGVNNQGNPCKVKDATAKTHADKCQHKGKDFCWMHCDCSYCSQLMGGSVKTQGEYFVEVMA